MLSFARLDLLNIQTLPTKAIASEKNCAFVSPVFDYLVRSIPAIPTD